MGTDAAALARAVYDAFNDRDWDAAMGLASERVEVTIVPFAMSASGRAGFRQFMESWVAMSSDLKVEVINQHVTPQGVVNEIVGAGTHDGPFVTPTGEIPATGRALEIPAVEVWEIADGQLTALRNYVDGTTMWQQIVDPARVEERIREFADVVINRGDLSRIPEFATEDWVDHEQGFPGISPDREGIGQFLTMFREAFPDLHFTIDEVLVAGDRATVQLRISGTHKGEFLGIPATGKSFEIAAIDIFRMEGDRAAEQWGVTDALAMMTQLGVAEPAAAT